MKTCTKCNNIYYPPLEKSFNKKKGTKDGYQNHCKICISEFHKEHYLERKDYYKDKAKKHNADYRLRNLQYTIDFLKEHPCIDCGEKDPVVLEFDHRGDKENNISHMITSSFEKLVDEIQKCDVRCSNCHKRKTAKQFNYYQGIKF
jgi:hypothetical protein